MKLLVTGSLGNISRPLTERLVQQGHNVTVVSHSAARQAAIEALGATAAIGSVTAADFLTTAFAGADAVYAMVPPNYATTDSRGYYRAVAGAYAQAIGQAGVRRVVHLSSWGAHLAGGTGGILGSHDAEGILDALPGVALTHLRPTSFYTNFYGLIGQIKAAGVAGVNCAGPTRVALVHATDIADVAAEELARPAPAGRTVRYVASDERTYDEVAQVLGAAIGRPDLRWVAFSDEQVRQSLVEHGLAPATAADVVDIYASIDSGRLGEDYAQHKPALGRVKLEDFAREFAAVFAG